MPTVTSTTVEGIAHDWGTHAAQVEALLRTMPDTTPDSGAKVPTGASLIRFD